jgi:hypothetical protein
MNLGRRLSAFQRLLVFVEAATIGVPFAVFKIVSGAALLQLGAPALAGWALVVLGVLDALVNLLNAVVVACFGARLLPICVLDILLIRRRKGLGPALDMMLSFSLVAAMIGTGHIGELPPSSLAAWNLAVICSVLGAGALRVLEATRRPAPDRETAE